MRKPRAFRNASAYPVIRLSLVMAACALAAPVAAPASTPAPPLEVAVDVKPGSCPNPFVLPKRARPMRGVLPVAILGTADFDVRSVDPASIRVTTVRSGRDVAPLRFAWEDVGTPFPGEPCACHDLDGDGFLDLTLKFRRSAVAAKLDLAQEAGRYVTLVVVGALLDGTPIRGEDCVRLRAKGEAPNASPAMDPLDDVAMEAGAHLDVPCSASDPDGDALAFSVAGLPAFGGFLDHGDGTCELSFAPGPGDGGEYPVAVSVTDGQLSDSEGFLLTVIAPNHPPAITSSPVTTAREGEPYEYDVEAVDPDAGDTLAFALDAFPAGMSIVPETGLIGWTPAIGQAGPHPVTVRVGDGHGGADTQSFTVEVSPAGECADGEERPCASACGAGTETCVTGAWQPCTAPLPQPEVCDGADNDCDGETDEGLLSPFFADGDGDGFGDPAASVMACAAPPGHVAVGGDCDDAAPAIHPGAEEIPNNCADEDCDGADLVVPPGDGVAEWYVDAGAPPGGDGRSWPTAMTGIGEAVAAAAAGDDIWVRSGTYHLDATIALDRALRIAGGFSGNDAIPGERDCAQATVVSGGRFTGFGFLVTADATLEDLTIERFWYHRWGVLNQEGGAVVVEDASPTISRCTFRENRGVYGGALFCRNTPGAAVPPATITDCSFIDNGAY